MFWNDFRKIIELNIVVLNVLVVGSLRLNDKWRIM
ncbi:MAG: sensor N-terminal transmembrane domain-containing protein [Kiritimatiellae bacterium]|nr:sensor N-terminal transmembrane domain-containing protein [Kiritimatiellia bacterium]